MILERRSNVTSRQAKECLTLEKNKAFARRTRGLDLVFFFNGLGSALGFLYPSSLSQSIQSFLCTSEPPLLFLDFFCATATEGDGVTNHGLLDFLLELFGGLLLAGESPPKLAEGTCEGINYKQSIQLLLSIGFWFLSHYFDRSMRLIITTRQFLRAYVVKKTASKGRKMARFSGIIYKPCPPSRCTMWAPCRKQGEEEYRTLSENSIGTADSLDLLSELRKRFF